MLSIGGLVAVFLHVPGKDANLVVVVRRTITRFGEKTEVLRNFLVSILNFIQHEKSDKSLAFSILRNVERHVDIHHAREHPSNAPLIIADEPPVLEHRTRGGLYS